MKGVSGLGEVQPFAISLEAIAISIGGYRYFIGCALGCLGVQQHGLV